jgi:hypothetical protein
MADTDQDQDAPQYKPSRQERLVGALDSWQKVVLAVTALLLAVGGLIAAAVKVSQTVQSPGLGDTPSHAADAGKSSTSAQQSSASAHATGIGTGIQLLSSQTLYLQSGSYLNCNSASGMQPAVSYFDLLGELTAGEGVNLAVLDPPAPTSGTAYAARRNDGAFTTQIMLNTLKPGSTVCVFTPNQQILWVAFLPVDPNSQSDALHISVFDWQISGG